MFYSQFILAKKGPLGTIWIAAHLERKLRKNQVADTDIGVSVDSILFPDVPIALRLSSHLLLGVVRIYSRKVNYLFHDCSEALLKIKQAFRSTAVDLPPEESTAPYHSITLPETFDLDDFELPDSAFQGDFVDHHVSAKDQITLQDTADGMGSSSLQFGSDERFGDGNGPQIGLDLDEDFFLDKHPSPQDVSAAMVSDECVMNQGQSLSSALTDIDNKQSVFIKDIDDGTPMDLSELCKYPDSHIHSNIEVTENNDASHWQGYYIKTPDFSEVFSVSDRNEGQTGHTSIADVSNLELTYCANAPFTPGLRTEAILMPVPESPMGSHQEHPPSFGETLKTDNPDMQYVCPDFLTDSGLKHASMMESKFGDGAQLVHSHTILSKEKQQFVLDGHCEQQSIDNQNHDNGENVLPEAAQMERLGTQSCPLEASNSEVPPDRSQAESEYVTATTSSVNSKVETQPLSNQELEEVADPCLKTSDSSLSLDCQLRSTSESNQANVLLIENGEPVQGTPEFSLEDRGKALHNTECMEKQVVHNMSGTLTESFPGIGSRNELSVGDSPIDSNLDQLNCSSGPEKMRLAQTSDADQGKESSLLTLDKGIAESDASIDRAISLSGRKRHLMDSASILPNGSSAKMSGRKPFRRSTDSIPDDDDDDLLASILVGKRTPLLRIGPTPPLPKATSLKRPRAMAKLGMLRKMLLDDTTVLHADVIRQQLMNSEDIQRIRKKAPCTRREIWMIHKSSAEDEIFNEPVTAGMSEELGTLHSQICSYKANEKERPEPIVATIIGSRGQDSPVVSVSTYVASSKAANNSDAQELSQCIVDMPHVEALGNGTPCIREAKETSEQERNVEINMPITSCHSIDRTPDEGLAIIENEVGIADKQIHRTSEKNSLIDCEVDCAATVSITEDKSSVDVVVNPSVPQEVSSKEGNELSTSGSCLPQVDENLLKDTSTVILVAGSFQDATMESGVPSDKAIGERDNQLGAGVEDVSTVQIILDRRENDLPDGSFSERSEMDSASSPKNYSEIHNIPSAVGENSGFLEFNLAGDVGVGSPMDFATAKECSDFCSAIDGNGTEFLNADDEVDYDEADDAPNPEEVQSLENSGWSSRTRAVARYLKNIFEGEYGFGRKGIAMDHLIAGKTRKEASRMFFETLVLKTKDYIQVEQTSSCSYINIEPRAKLLKSEF